MLLLHFVTSVTFFSNNAAVFDRQSSTVNKDLILKSGAPNEDIVQNYLTKNS